MDKFPEAFRRFEKVVDVSEIKSYVQLELTFSSWAGHKWYGTYKQKEALKVEALKHGIPIRGPKEPEPQPKPERRTWRQETVTVRGETSK